MRKCWVAVASKDHVAVGVKGGFAQACHGKPGPLKRMKVGDCILYYSPKIVFDQPVPCQEFTAIGHIAGDEVYQFDMGGGFAPFRRDVVFYKEATAVPIKQLLLRLNFIEDKKRWGSKFRFGLFEIPMRDFDLIASCMLKRQESTLAQAVIHSPTEVKTIWDHSQEGAGASIEDATASCNEKSKPHICP